MSKRQIAFVCDFWNHAGTEIAAINWLNTLSHDYDVTLFLLEDKINVQKHLNENIKIQKNFVYSNYYGRILCLKHWAILKIPGIKLMRKIVWNSIFKDGQYNAIINFPDSSATFFKYLNFNKTKLIAWNHFNYGENVNFAHGNLHQLRDKYYNGYLNSNYVVSVSKSAQNSFNSFFSSYGTTFNVKSIYTPQNVSLIQKKSLEDVNVEYKKGFNVLQLARINEMQKGQLRMLKVISKLNKVTSNVNFYFIGDATDIELQKFQKLKAQLKLNNVYYLGKKINPYPYIKKCDLFILPSRFEGYGLVLEEALILNKPVITTNITSAEILNNQEYGFVCENNSQAIYEKLDEVLNNKQTYEILKQKASKFKTHNEEIMTKFKQLLK